jgi:L-amino acid N-acyltransferase YncA
MIVDANLTDLVFIAKLLRNRDKQELAATRSDVDPDQLAIDSYNSHWRKVAYTDDNFPAMAIGARVTHPGVATVWGFATDHYRKVIRELSNYVEKAMIPEIVGSGVHRAQCLVHPENRASQRWLKSLGFIQEATLRGFGSSREDMLLFAWLDHEFSRTD